MKKKIISVITVIVLISLAICPQLLAGASSIKQNKYFTVSKDKYYKISVSSEGYITLYAKANVSSEAHSYSSAIISLLNSKKADFTGYGACVRVSTGSGSYPKTDSVIIPVSKGTYYIHCNNISLYKGGSASAKYTFTSMKTKTNYTSGTATVLKSGTAASIMQTQMNAFNRWFVIKLTKNQKVKLTINSFGYSRDSINIFDAEGNKIDFSVENDSVNREIFYYTTKSNLAKGTYYIECVAGNFLKRSTYYTLKWK